MNSAFMPDDSARLASGYTSVDPATGAGGIIFDHHASGGHPGQQTEQQHQVVVDQDSAHQQLEQHQQQPQIVRFSPSAETRTQTPAAKRSREDDESEAGESESNSRSITEPNPVEKRSGRRKIKIEYIEDKSRRHITFSKRKAGIMKKAYELSTLTGTQVLLLVVSETGLVYTFTTPKLQPIVTQPEGKNLIQACLSVPDQPGERVSQPIPTESNAYMSQPRHSQVVGNAYANSAMAAAVAAASNAAALGGANNGNGAFATGDDRKQQLGAADESPGGAGVNHAAQPYLQYPYGQSAVAQAVAAAASGGMQYATLPGYASASYPNSNSQSQHHSPIAASTQHAPQQQQQQQQQGTADASSIPGMGSLASYHHGYGGSHAQQQQQQQPMKQQNHYAYHSLQAQGQYQHHQSPHSDGQSGHNSSSVTEAMAAAVVAATASGNGHHSAQQQQQHQGNISAVPYMAANHYWPPAAGLASPHLPQPQNQHQQSQQAAAGLIQRAGYGNGGN
ncbi:transcription factor of the MADS box [Coemansia sp. RSA 487]|nr:transcription factor of the MADS box [Coemansia sp. RSA 487]